MPEAETIVENAGACLIDAARDVAAAAFASGARLDQDDSFPADEIALASQRGLLALPLPLDFGGPRFDNSRDAALTLARVLRIVGWGSLPLGRVFEGHVNGVRLCLAYGTPAQRRRYAALAAEGHLFGVWNTQAEPGVTLEDAGGELRLVGHKTFASGVGFVDVPVITARRADGGIVMVAPTETAPRGDLTAWTAHGMRASRSGSADFSDIRVTPDEVIGDAGDYTRQPVFSGGAWRFCAVQLGGMDRIFDLLRAHHRATGRGADPHQAARLGQAAIAVETAAQFVTAACLRAEASDADAAEIVAYVDLTRTAVERAALDLLELAHRSVGLAGFSRAHPLERVGRDLATYLRQPAPDRALANGAAHVLDALPSSLDLWTQCR